MNRQEMFNAVWTHFVTNKQPASIIPHPLTGRPVCRYRGPNGMKCAVGVLLPDEAYRSEMDPMYLGTPYTICTIAVLIDEHPHWFPDWMIAESSFLSSLQDAHDQYGDFGSLEGALLDVARHYGLLVPS